MFVLVSLLIIAIIYLGAALPTSMGRTVPFTPVPGKYGYVCFTAGSLSGVYLNVAQWSPQQSASPLPVTNFNSPKDNNDNIHQEDVSGTVGTTYNVVGVRDAYTGQGYHPTAGDTGYGVLGYNPSLFYPVYFIVTSVGGPCTVEGVSGLEFSIKAVGLALMNGRNGGA